MAADHHEGFVKKITSVDHWMHWVGLIVLSVCFGIVPPLVIYYLGGLNHHHQLINSKGEINVGYQRMNNLYHTATSNLINFTDDYGDQKKPTQKKINPNSNTVTAVPEAEEDLGNGDIALYWFGSVMVLLTATVLAPMIYYLAGVGRTLDKIRRLEFVSPEDLHEFQRNNGVFYGAVGGQIGLSMWFVGYHLLFMRELDAYIVCGWYEQICHLWKLMTRRSSKSVQEEKTDQSDQNGSVDSIVININDS
ncbi:OLC1v1019742C1 [Oldenlandia corymbosa var. corymbosa]|uniref:OLC1v1019742C1 n=1 Tax=Oldenlandia corymbosa var. corymbosa TaxID=529605 RepID=A0AAV1EEM8_OLDCO|nr:OLC1v1019742C1 [Oldenlandia corymbosa var. corymbosa]